MKIQKCENKIYFCIISGVEKTCWKGGGWKEAGVEGGGGPSLSPDLGFVDYPDLRTSAHKPAYSNQPTTANYNKSSNCDTSKKLPFVCLASLKPGNNSSSDATPPFFAPTLLKPPLSLATAPAKKSTTSPLLKKKVTVEIEKLPTTVPAANMFLMSQTSTTKVGRRTASKNRKLDRPSKEISLIQKDIILNSFRIVGNPPVPGGSASPTNFKGFSPRTFYKNSSENKFSSSISSSCTSASDITVCSSDIAVSSCNSNISSNSDITKKTEEVCGSSGPSESQLLPGLRTNSYSSSSYITSSRYSNSSSNSSSYSNNSSNSSSLVSSPISSNPAAETARPFR